MCSRHASSVLFCDEATFSSEGVFNTHNVHMWALNNPHSTRPRAAQQYFLVNEWVSITGDCLLCPYILPPRLDSHKNLVFLQEVLLELLTDVFTPIRCRMWFQQDGAPFHYGRRGTIWTVHFQTGVMQSLVHDTPVNSEMDLVVRISITAATIRETPGIFEQVCQSMSRRCRACINAKGCSYKPIRRDRGGSERPFS
ncbi:transposable element Tcb1 transposase [Trichonephila clavipes]|nr:transposable element Tcb1 transposase [Trichonephila clavipes]